VSVTNLITDGYERKARLYPALLLIAPIVFVLVAMLSTKQSTLESLLAAAVGFGGVFLLTQLARDRGKRREKQLFAKWGGLPSIAIFRHRNGTLDSITKTRYHKKLADLVKEAKAPTTEEEQANPTAADAAYAAWSHYLRVNTRDRKRFPLLFQENVNYGYRRNVWGLRPLGIVVCSLTSLIAAVHLYFVHRSTGHWDGATVAAGAFSGILLWFWIFRFSANWVRVPADAYAARLAECVEQLDSDHLPTLK